MLNMRHVNMYNSGDKYNRYMLTGKSYIHPSSRDRMVEYICECHTIGWTYLTKLAKGKTKSCGCYKTDKATKHGMSEHPIRFAWKGMIYRCYNKNSSQYIDYGGRGIDVCDEWRNNFNSFKVWALLNGWEKGLSIDRIDNEGIYSPDNCRWATIYIQSRNKRNNKYYEAFGENKCLTDWVADSRCSVLLRSVVYRLEHGWNIEDAISLPPTNYNSNYTHPL